MLVKEREKEERNEKEKRRLCLAANVN